MHMPSSNKTDGQVLGCLLGGALGDAWGGPWEGSVGPSHFKAPSQSKVSDDTQLTLATCESIIEAGCIDPESLASHFLEWFVQGRISGMGSSTLKAMRDLSAGVHWALAGSREEYAAGSGAAMRIARWHSYWSLPKPVTAQSSVMLAASLIITTKRMWVRWR